MLNIDTSINFLGKKFEHPIIIASGILGVTGASMCRSIRYGAAGVTMKSISLNPRSKISHLFCKCKGFERNAINCCAIPFSLHMFSFISLNFKIFP